MRVLIQAFIITLCFGSVAASAYPGMQPAATPAKPQSSVDKIQQLPEPYALDRVSFTDKEGHSVDFSQYQGKVVMVNMWATWCPPCVRELPALDALAKKLDKQDFVVLPISIDAEGQSLVKPFLSQLGMADFNSFYDQKQALSEIFPLDYIPATFILNKQGQLIAFVRSYVDWSDPKAEKMILEWLK
ncbi:TlpA disulfide reductase family protein [Shewanella sp. NIFS-20-20]|uniref:TlpA disulfide reductase family protein n=1 Tax=Shewanella sp. NIFS-20-20 TaxID=2853806 RepID=UPI001C442479|nr:TlpA disulfide reductase family protein [Shewanella sp. NIFS-20-20]MBV7317608.1 TlpA family protein disulfide reductase [Shewanella sp. NIFS-20-20]